VFRLLQQLLPIANLEQSKNVSTQNKDSKKKSLPFIRLTPKSR